MLKPSTLLEAQGPGLPWWASLSMHTRSRVSDPSMKKAQSQHIIIYSPKMGCCSHESSIAGFKMTALSLLLSHKWKQVQCFVLVLPMFSWYKFMKPWKEEKKSSQISIAYDTLIYLKHLTPYSNWYYFFFDTSIHIQMRFVKKSCITQVVGKKAPFGCDSDGFGEVLIKYSGWNCSNRCQLSCASKGVLWQAP